jgi:hypothetical protein
MSDNPNWNAHPLDLPNPGLRHLARVSTKQWARAVRQQFTRVSTPIPDEDAMEEFEARRFDFEFLLVSAMRLQRAVELSNEVLGSEELRVALGRFTSTAPWMAEIRNATEHFDDYAAERGRSKNLRRWVTSEFGMGGDGQEVTMWVFPTVVGEPVADAW